MFKAGTALADVSPKTSMHMAGYPEPENRCTTGVHDPLYVSAYYLANGKDELLLYTADLCSFNNNRVAALRKRIEETCGIPGDHVLMSCTHTHSGPVTGSRPFSTERAEMYPEYNAFLEETMLNLAVEAKKGAFPAKIGIEKALCGKEQGIGGNRHDPNGVTDPEVYTICIKDANDEVRGILVDYSLHPTLLHAENFLASADYPGYMRIYFAEKYPKAVFGFFQGTSGNQSSRFFRNGQTFEEAERFGRTIAAAADKAIASMTFTDEVPLKAKIVTTRPTLKVVPSVEEAAEKVARSKAELERLERENAPYPIRRSAECTLIGANLMHTIAKSMLTEEGRKDSEAFKTLDLQIIAIGDARLVCSPAELFVEFGLAIKAQSPAEKTFVVTLANGTGAGYVFTRQAWEEGGYEASGSRYTAEAGDIIVRDAVEALKTL